MTELYQLYGVAFGAGLLSFLSPCVLPLVPVYLANLAGVTAVTTGTRTSYLPALFHSLSFVLGICLVYAPLGALLALVGHQLLAHTLMLSKISGGFIIALGIFFIAAYKLPWLNYEKRLTLAVGGNLGYLRSIVIGVVFALGWTPCVGPIAGTIAAMAFGLGSAWQGASLLAVYSLALGLPFIAMSLAWGSVMPFWKGLNRHLGTIALVTGVLLIAVGALVFSGVLSLQCRAPEF